MARFTSCLSLLALACFMTGCGDSDNVTGGVPETYSDDRVALKTASPEPTSAEGGGSGSPDADFALARPRGEGAAESEAPAFNGGESSIVPQRDQIQSGTLTAGSLNDHENYAAFRDYARTALQNSGNLGQVMSQFDARRALIEVVNPEGLPVADARVTVRMAENQISGVTLRYEQQKSSGSDLIELRTGSDGRTVFIPSLDGAGQAGEFEIVVEADGHPAVIAPASLDQTPWKVTIDQAEQQLPQQLDLALVIDTTGSMGDELEYLKVEIDSIAQRVHELYPNVDQRYALILYRDQGDAYVTRTFDFTGSLQEFRANLDKQSANGGGDYPEAMHAALDQTTKLNWRSGNAARVALLVGDAPPHVGDLDATATALQSLRRKEVTVFPVASSGVREQAEFVLRYASFLTMGQYLFLTDHSGVGNPHAKPTAPEYDVERLDQLMIRMIATELAGRSVLPRDIIATEEDGAAAVPLPEQTSLQQQVTPHELLVEGHPQVKSQSPGVVRFVGRFGRQTFAFVCLAGIVLLENRRSRRNVNR